jgi:hypothetical protein
MRPTLADADILVRPFKADDVDSLYAAIRESIDTVGRWMSWCHPDYSIREAEEWIARCEKREEKGARLDLFGYFMPRRPRIHLAGVPLHSVQRGHNRDACFFGEDDLLGLPPLVGRSPQRKRLRPARLRAHDQPCAFAADSTAAPRRPPAHPLYRAQPRTCRQGGRPGALPLEQLPCKRAGTTRPPDYPASAVHRLGCG